MSEHTHHERQEPLDDKQRRYNELKRQRIAIDNEMRDLREQMKYGVCEVCGRAFTRMRASKKFCSQRCGMKAFSQRDEARRVFDLNHIRVALPAIEAARLMTPRTLNIVRDVCARDEHWTTYAMGEHFGVSHQRISQILVRAQKLATMVALISAVKPNHSNSSEEVSA